MMELRPLLRQYTVYPKFVDNPGIENGEHAALQQAHSKYTLHFAQSGCPKVFLQHLQHPQQCQQGPPLHLLTTSV
jgi:hypothetical protein